MTARDPSIISIIYDSGLDGIHAPYIDPEPMFRAAIVEWCHVRTSSFLSWSVVSEALTESGMSTAFCTHPHARPAPRTETIRQSAGWLWHTWMPTRERESGHDWELVGHISGSGHKLTSLLPTRLGKGTWGTKAAE